MTLQVPVSAATQQWLSAAAAAAGTTTEAFAAGVLEKAKPRTLAEVMAPFAAEVEELGITEDELDAIIEQARQGVWEGGQRKRGGA